MLAVFTRGGEFCTHRYIHRRQTTMWAEAETGVMEQLGKECQKLSATRSQGEARKDSFLEPAENVALPINTLISKFYTPELSENKFLLA